jgi:hypothetical protein
MTDRELMQDALDALNNFDKGNHGMRWQVPIIKALRARLSQPEPAECDGGQCGIGGYCKQCPKTQPDVPETAFGEIKPVAWKMKGVPAFATSRPNDTDSIKWDALYTAPPQRKPKPEPVAWTVSNLITDFSRDFSAYQTKTYTRPLYTAPPQREWQGLTDSEREQIEIKANDKSEMTAWEYAHRVGKFTEDKLKEKNT